MLNVLDIKIFKIILHIKFFLNLKINHKKSNIEDIGNFKHLEIYYKKNLFVFTFLQYLLKDNLEELTNNNKENFILIIF